MATERDQDFEPNARPDQRSHAPRSTERRVAGFAACSWSATGDVPTAFERIVAVIGPEDRHDASLHMMEALDPFDLGAMRERLAAAS